MVNEPKRNILDGIENTGDVHLHDHRLRLKQRFDIIRKLGQGTYGKVQLGINKKTGQEVAIKTIKKCKIETEADLIRLRREVQIMSSVRHPNIIHIYEVFENSEKMILVMEYCSGGELYDYLSERKVLQEDEARRLFRQIATAVYYCHKHKICHRDLKLENVLLDEHGSAKIADFGLSNVFEDKRLLSTFCGSPLYASPEIVKGTPYIGPEVDCWSLGVLLYTLVYGAMPFDGSNFKRLVKQISTGDYFEPKNPSSASPLIRDMLTVDPIQRADITHICDHPWVNKGSDVACLELAEALANETPVRLDLLLSLAPPPVSDKLVVTDEVGTAGPDGSPGRSMSIAAIDASAERRILEMVAEGGTDAIKPSPTRTIMGGDQPKRKLETAVSMDSAPSQRKKERFLRSSSKVDNLVASQNEASAIPVENNHHQELQKDISMVEQNKVSEGSPKAPNPELPVNQKVIKTPTNEAVKPSSPSELDPENIVPNQVTNNHIESTSPSKTPPVNLQIKKDVKTDSKPRDTVLKEKNAITKPSTGVKKKVGSSVWKGDDKKVVKTKEKSPPRKSLEKDSVKKQSPEAEVQSLKQPTERRKSRILDAAEKLNSLSIQPSAPAPVASPPTAKPKKVIIPGVSVGSFKEQFERRASLTSSAPVVEKKPAKSTPGQAAAKSLADKKIHSVDSEHPVTTPPPLKPVEKEPANVKLQHIGIEPTQQPEVSLPPPEPEKKQPTAVPEAPSSAPLYNNKNKVTKPLHKSESLREHSNKKDAISNSVSLEDARKSLQNSIALISQAKNDHQSSKSLDETTAESERQHKLKAAREIISNAIGDDNNTGKKVQRICMGGKPPMPYGASGRSASGSLNFISHGGSPPLSPPHQTITSPSATPPRTYRTEVHHRMEDVRNKFLPTARGGSIERIIPIHFTSEVPVETPPPPSVQPVSPPQSTQLPYQRNKTMPYRLSSVPRSTSVQSEVEREPSQPSTPFKQMDSPRIEPIKKSPREFIIPIAVEGVGYVTPRQGSLEPSDTPTKLPSSNLPFGSRFPKPRRLSSLVSGGESEDEEDVHMHRLRSSRRTRADPEKDSVSSGEEDEDDEGFELLTAENLFSTLLDRVRNLTNRLNGEEGTGFPQRHQSLFNNLHSPFFNSPHLPRKHNIHSLMRDGPSWRRSTSRDIASDFDSMFPSHTTFPRGTSRRSSRKGAKYKGDQQQQTSQLPSQDHTNYDTTALKNNLQYPQEHLDLSDLDLSQIELTEKEVETLSGLTPGLSRRLQKQLFSHLPPAAARSLRRTLSAHLPQHQHPHHYSRSHSASKTDPLSCTSPIEGENDFELQPKENIVEDDEESSISYNSAKSYIDKDYKERSDKYSDISDVPSVVKDRSYHSVNTERSKSPSYSESSAPYITSDNKKISDRSVLGKYLSPERLGIEKYPSNNDYEYTSLLTEPSYIAAYGGPANSSIPLGGSLKRRSLRTPPIENGQRRISRFLRPDFFDTPREESIYVKDNVKDKKEMKEIETQKVLKEIRQKRLKSTDLYQSNPTSPSTPSDILYMYESRSSISPISGSLICRDKSRSVTPFYPILDNISEHNTDHNTNLSLRSALSDITKHCSENEILQDQISNTEKHLEEDSKAARPVSYPSKPADKISLKPVNIEENATNVKQVIPQKPNPSFESKLLRPKSYPSTSPSPEKFTGILPKPKVYSGLKSKQLDSSDSGPSAPSADYANQNVSVSFSLSIPAKSNNKNTAEDDQINQCLGNSINEDIQNGNVPGIINGNIQTTLKGERLKAAAELNLEKCRTFSPVQTQINSNPENKCPEKKIEPVDEADSKKSNPDASKSCPPKGDEGILGEEKKKKIIKKKIIVKKKVSLKKTDPNKSSEKPSESDAQVQDLEKSVTKDEKASPSKKKSVLHSIGERFERFRVDNFNKASQEKDAANEVKGKDRATPVKEDKPSRIENVIRALRERSVPNNNQEEQVTESGLIKRAVTITDLPTLDIKSSTSKKTVNKVLGLFKKVDSKDNNSKGDSSADYSTNSKCSDNKNIPKENGVASVNEDTVADKPKRPTSLLLNGIGRRVQARYNGTTSDSVLANDTNQIGGEKTSSGLVVKTDETKSQKKGLRLDFSKLPRLNQSIFNKRNSQDVSKSREGSVCKSRESSVAKSRENSICKELHAHSEELQNGAACIVSTNSIETLLSPCLDGNANNTLSSATSLAWSPDYDSSNFMLESPMENDINHNGNHLPQRCHEATSPDPENMEDRIRRRSFYSRFNEKKSKRKSLLVGPGAKEYNPTERIHSHTDSDSNLYYNRYDFSPTSSTKSDKASDFGKYSDKNESLSPTKYRSGPMYSYKSLDRNDRKYSLDPPCVEKTSEYSNPRYSRTISMHDNYDSKLPPTDARKNSRYGRSYSLLSPGNYNTYNPRSHSNSRNSAILLRDDTETEPYSTDSILTKIRNRKKSLETSPTFDGDDYLDTKYRSNSKHDASDNEVES